MIDWTKPIEIVRRDGTVYPATAGIRTPNNLHTPVFALWTDDDDGAPFYVTDNGLVNLDKLLGTHLFPIVRNVETGKEPA